MDITLGDTGLKTHRISLGSVKFGRNTDVKYPEKFIIPNQKQVSNLISIAGEMGINLIDTAPAYGESEKKIGKAISRNRNKWIVSTKVGEKYENKRSYFDFSRTGVLNSVHQSLENLKTEAIDILLIHSNENELDIINNSDVDSERFLFWELGYNVRPTEISATLGINELQKIDKYVEIRNMNYEEYKSRLKLLDDKIQIQNCLRSLQKISKKVPKMMDLGLQNRAQIHQKIK